MCGCFGAISASIVWKNAKGHFYLLPRAEQLSSKNECLCVTLARITPAVTQIQCRES